MKKVLNIVKIGGKILSDQQQLHQVLTGFSTLDTLKILVHGGGKTGSEVAKKMGIEVKMVEGRRITDADMLEVAVMVYGGLKNKGLVAQLQSLGTKALGLSGADLDIIRAIKRPPGKIDYGFAGDIVSIDSNQIRDLLNSGIVPVFAPLTHDGQGQMLNTNADTIAASLSTALAKFYQVNLIFCFEKIGVLTDPEDESSLIKTLTLEAYERFRAEGVISGGMIPKLDNAFSALESGIHCVYICNASAIENLKSPNFIGSKIFLN